MMQIYAHPRKRLLMSLLLQCVMVLLAHTQVYAQTASPALANFDGPWARSTNPNVIANSLSADGADFEISTGGGSAQFNSTSSMLTLRFDAVPVNTRLNFSLKAATTKATYSAGVRVETSVDGSSYSPLTAITLTQADGKEELRYTQNLPVGTTHVRFSMSTRTDANLLLDAVAVLDGPEVISFSPEEGGFNQQVTVKGSGFSSATKVFFGAVEGTIVGTPTNGELIALVPAGAPDGVITVEASGKSGASRTTFDVYAPVVTTKFTPATGGAGETVTITGQYFAGATSVTFNGVAGTILENTDTQLKVTVPAGASTGKIKITTPGGEGTSYSNFTVPAPKFSATNAFTPTTGGAGTVVTLNGMYFSGVTEVKLNGVAAAIVANPQGADADKVVTVEVPANAGSGYITLKTPAGTATTAAAFNFIPAPVVLSVNPLVGTIGETVEITGRNLENLASVTFAGTADVAATPSAITTDAATGDQKFTVTVPSGAQTGGITISNPGGTVTTDVFTIAAAPLVDAFSPASARPGEQVTIIGSNFTGVNNISFAGTAEDVVAPAFTINSDIEIVVTVPIGAQDGVIKVENPAGSISSAEAFTLDTTPFILAFTPTEQVQEANITITGFNLSGATAVDFAGATATVQSGAVTTDPQTAQQQLTVVVPTGASSGTVAVTTAAGTATSTEQLTIITEPQIISLSKTEGRVNDSFTLTGTGFTGATAVTIGGQQVGFTLVDDTQITVTVTANAIDGPVAVTNKAGTGDSGTNEFTVLNTPLITGFTPTSAAVSSSITISGRLLGQITGVSFNGGAPVAPITVSENELTVEVPTGATTGKITVSGSNGSATSEEDFTVAVAPSNIAFTPTEGRVGETEVTITGNNLEGATKVFFGGAEVSVSAANFSSNTETGATELKLIVPAKAVTSQLIVENAAGKSPLSAATFTVLVPEITDVYLSADNTKAEGYAGEAVTILGQYFNGATEVSFNGFKVGAGEFTVVSDTEITATAPFNAGKGTVAVTTPSGVGTSATEFEVYKPLVTDFTPKTTYAGITVSVTGERLLYDRNDANVKPKLSFAGKTLTEAEVISYSDTEITFEAPFDAGSGNLIVETTSGRTSVAGAKVYEPEGLVVKRDGAVANWAFEGDNLVIEGINLNKGRNGETVTPRVSFTSTANNKLDVTVSSVSETSLAVTVPTGAATGPIYVETTSGIGQTASFRIVQEPEVISFNPAKGVREVTAVTVTGSDFFGVTDVQLNGVSLGAGNYTTSADGASIVFTVPSGATSGPITVSNKKGSRSSSANFRVVLPPTISAYANEAPGSFGPQAGSYGTTVKITGTNLLLEDIVAVTFGGVAAAPGSMASNAEGTELTVLVPTGAQDGDLVIENMAGAVVAGNFIITNPTITNITNKTQPSRNAFTSRRGETILISGTKLRDVGSISFAGATTSQFYRISDEELEVIVPRNASTGFVTVNTLEGSGTSAQELEVIVPVITVSPASLPEFSAEAGKESAVQTYSVSATNLESSITLVAPRGGKFQVSLDGTTFGTSATLPQPAENTLASTDVYVKFVPGTDEDYFTGLIAHSATNAETKYVFISGNSATPLPVELMAFDVKLQQSKALLTWATAMEQNNSHFEVQVSQNAKNGFVSVGRVESKATNSQSRQDYSYTHSLANMASTVYFRLKQVDLDGTTAYSSVRSLSLQAVEALAMTVAPNPINYNSKVIIRSDVNGKARLALHSISGKKVYAKNLELNLGYNEIQLPVYEQIGKGLYILTLEVNGTVHQLKLLKE